MAGRIESEIKKTAYIEACKNIDALKVVPEKLLQAQHLIKELQMDEIDMTMLYKYGCPCNWIKNAHKQCQLKNKQKLTPKYSNECATCWLYNLTDEISNIPITKKEYDINKIITKYNEFKKLELTPEQLTEVLTYLGWMDIYDYGLFFDTIKDMKKIYQLSKGTEL